MLTRAAALILSMLAVLAGTGASAAAMSTLSLAPPASLRAAPSAPAHHRSRPAASHRPRGPVGPGFSYRIPLHPPAASGASELPRSGYELPGELVVAAGLVAGGLLLRRRRAL